MKFLELNRKYERHIEGKKFVIYSFICGLFVTLFLLVFKPFGLYEWEEEHKTLYIIGFGAVTTLTLLLTYLIHEVWLNRKIQTLGQQVTSLFFRTFLIGLGNIIYAMSIGRIDFTIQSVLWYLWVTFAVGLFPVTGILLFDFLKRAMKPNENNEKLLVLHSDNKNEKVSVKVDELLFISAADNYCEVFCFDQSLKRALIRSSLKDMLEQIPNPEIIRCHRSYIVNLNQVSDYSGNAQGLKLFLKHANKYVLVSRKYVPVVKEHLSHLPLPDRHFTTHSN